MKNILFITTDLSRNLINLCRELNKIGFNTTIAAPKSKNMIYLLEIPFIQIGLFNKKLYKYIYENNPIIHCLDKKSTKMVKKFNFIDSQIDFGININIWNPDRVSILAQTRFLDEHNIASHQKLISVISPFGEKLNELINIVDKIPDEYIFGLYGNAGYFKNRKIINKVKNISHRIIFFGKYADLPTLLRTSFINLSLTESAIQMIRFATAMGKPVVIGANNLEPALKLSLSERKSIEQKNIESAKKFSLEKTVKECAKLYKI